jgi:hypothetical protein
LDYSQEVREFNVKRAVRIEVQGKDEFWSRAFQVEWQHQFADRKLTVDGAGHYLAEEEWLGELERVAAQTFCRIIRAPDVPERRRWISSLMSPKGKR